jgi:hypothetical protein
MIELHCQTIIFDFCEPITTTVMHRQKSVRLTVEYKTWHPPPLFSFHSSIEASSEREAPLVRRGKVIQAQPLSPPNPTECIRTDTDNNCCTPADRLVDIARLGYILVHQYKRMSGATDEKEQEQDDELTEAERNLRSDNPAAPLYRFVFTGGPCGGTSKTTPAEKYRSERVDVWLDLYRLSELTIDLASHVCLPLRFFP